MTESDDCLHQEHASEIFRNCYKKIPHIKRDRSRVCRRERNGSSYIPLQQVLKYNGVTREGENRPGREASSSIKAKCPSRTRRGRCVLRALSVRRDDAPALRRLPATNPGLTFRVTSVFAALFISSVTAAERPEVPRPSFSDGPLPARSLAHAALGLSTSETSLNPPGGESPPSTLQPLLSSQPTHNTHTLTLTCTNTLTHMHTHTQVYAHMHT